MAIQDLKCLMLSHVAASIIIAMAEAVRDTVVRQSRQKKAALRPEKGLPALASATYTATPARARSAYERGEKMPSNPAWPMADIEKYSAADIQAILFIPDRTSSAKAEDEVAAWNDISATPPNSRYIAVF